MPTYDFKSDDGQRIERLVSLGTEELIEEGVTYKRVPNLEGFAFTGRAVGGPPQKEQVKGGYYKLEQEKGSRFLKQSLFTTKQIKKAWGI